MTCGERYADEQIDLRRGDSQCRGDHEDEYFAQPGISWIQDPLMSITLLAEGRPLDDNLRDTTKQHPSRQRHDRFQAETRENGDEYDCAEDEDDVVQGGRRRWNEKPAQ